MLHRMGKILQFVMCLVWGILLQSVVAKVTHNLFKSTHMHIITMIRKTCVGRYRSQKVLQKSLVMVRYAQSLAHQATCPLNQVAQALFAMLMRTHGSQKESASR
jgi:hypothetical protein